MNNQLSFNFSDTTKKSCLAIPHSTYETNSFIVEIVEELPNAEKEYIYRICKNAMFIKKDSEYWYIYYLAKVEKIDDRQIKVNGNYYDRVATEKLKEELDE